MDPTDHHLIPDAWTLVAFNASAALIITPIGALLRGQLAGDDAPPLISDFGGFAIRGMRLVRGIAPFQALWLRAEGSPVSVTVYKGNSMSGVVYFGKSPLRQRALGPVLIQVPYVPQTLDGGGPDTDYSSFYASVSSFDDTWHIVMPSDGGIRTINFCQYLIGFCAASLVGVCLAVGT